jgi:hypothetical protein
MYPSTQSNTLQQIELTLDESIAFAADKIEACFEHYIQKFGRLNNNTAVQIVRTIETQIIAEQRLENIRSVRNKIRYLLLSKLERE